MGGNSKLRCFPARTYFVRERTRTIDRRVPISNLSKIGTVVGFLVTDARKADRSLSCATLIRADTPSTLDGCMRPARELRNRGHFRQMSRGLGGGNAATAGFGEMPSLLFATRRGMRRTTMCFANFGVVFFSVIIGHHAVLGWGALVQRLNQDFALHWHQRLNVALNCDCASAVWSSGERMRLNRVFRQTGEDPGSEAAIPGVCASPAHDGRKP